MPADVPIALSAGAGGDIRGGYDVVRNPKSVWFAIAGGREAATVFNKAAGWTFACSTEGRLSSGVTLATLPRDHPLRDAAKS